MAGRPRDEAKEARWRGRVRAQEASGLSIRRYCATKKLSEPLFHRWKRTLAARNAQSAPEASGAVRSGPFAELVVSRPGRSGPAALSMLEGANAQGASLRVEFPCGARLELAPGFDEATFARAARALLGAESC